MVSNTFTRSSSTRLTPRGVSSPRHLSPRVSFGQRKWWAPSGPTFENIALAIFLGSIFIVFGCALYLHFFRHFVWGSSYAEVRSENAETCDVFDGSWVPDAGYPLYNSSECPFVERGFNCLANGRKDVDYLKWRWKPHNCNMPRFDARNVLKWLKGKRVVFVGDSMSRTQWESFICMLMSGVRDRENVYEVNGNQISKTIRFLGVRFASFNLSVEFYRSVFLVQQGSPPHYGPKRVRATLKLDKMDDINSKWADSDILIFNSGHWWTPTKLFDMGFYFEEAGMLKLGTSINAAFRIALNTWALWVQNTINTNRTHVFFRTFEPSHWSGSNQKLCKVTELPSSEAKGNDRSEFGNIIADVVSNMSVPVTILNVTLMGAFRSDAHLGTWTNPSTILDCSHWCLPGVPDAWNELVFSYLFKNGWKNSGG